MHEVVCEYYSTELCYFQNIIFFYMLTRRNINLNASVLRGLC